MLAVAENQVVNSAPGVPRSLPIHLPTLPQLLNTQGEPAYVIPTARCLIFCPECWPGSDPTQRRHRSVSIRKNFRCHDQGFPCGFGAAGCRFGKDARPGQAPDRNGDDRIDAAFAGRRSCSYRRHPGPGGAGVDAFRRTRCGPCLCAVPGETGGSAGNRSAGWRREPGDRSDSHDRSWETAPFGHEMAACGLL